MKRLHTQLLGARLEVSQVKLAVIADGKPFQENRFLQLKGKTGDICFRAGAMSIPVYLPILVHL